MILISERPAEVTDRAVPGHHRAGECTGAQADGGHGRSGRPWDAWHARSTYMSLVAEAIVAAGLV